MHSTLIYVTFTMVDYIYNECIRVRFTMNAYNTVELLLMCMTMVFLCVWGLYALLWVYDRYLYAQLFLCFGMVFLHYMYIGHAKIYIYSTPVSYEKSTDKIANYTGKPLISTGIPLVPSGIPLWIDCIAVSFWFFEFVRYLAVYRLYRSVYRYRGSAVRAIGLVGWTLTITAMSNKIIYYNYNN
jgi:hypothetical protein